MSVREAAPNPVRGGGWSLWGESRGVGREALSALPGGLGWSALEFDHPPRAHRWERAPVCGPGSGPAVVNG